MNDAEKDRLRQSILDHLTGAQNAEPLPLPPGAPPGLTPVQQETLFQNWCDFIYARPAPTWTPLEREAIRVASARALRTL
jgi:hypothetical protein